MFACLLRFAPQQGKTEALIKNQIKPQMQKRATLTDSPFFKWEPGNVLLSQEGEGGLLLAAQQRNRLNDRSSTTVRIIHCVKDDRKVAFCAAALKVRAIRSLYQGVQKLNKTADAKKGHPYE